MKLEKILINIQHSCKFLWSFKDTRTYHTLILLSSYINIEINVHLIVHIWKPYGGMLNIFTNQSKCFLYTSAIGLAGRHCLASILVPPALFFSFIIIFIRSVALVATLFIGFPLFEQRMNALVSQDGPSCCTSIYLKRLEREIGIYFEEK